MRIYKRGGGLEKFKKLDFSEIKDTKEGYVFHILTSDIKANNAEKLTQLSKRLSEFYPCEILIHFVDASLFDAAVPPPWIEDNSAFYRFLSCAFLDEGVQTCLYLDVDMIVLFDVRELFALNLEQNILAAVLDVNFSFHQGRLCRAKKEGLKDITMKNEYFNSGFMLINVREFKKQNTEQKCFEFMQDYTYDIGDQEILNAVVWDKVLFLPKRYNFLLGSLEKNTLFYEDYCIDESEWAHHNLTRAEFNQEKDHIQIAHFTHIAGTKPWTNVWEILGKNFQIPLCPYRGLWWKIALETPEFEKELLAIYNAVEYNALQSYARVLGQKLTTVLEEISPSAVKIVQNHLCYKIGLELMKYRGFKDIFKLCFKLVLIGLKHRKMKKLNKLNKALKKINGYGNLKLERCLDYEKSKALVQSKAYKLGKDFLKHSKKWYKGALVKFAFVKIKAFCKDNK